MVYEKIYMRKIGQISTDILVGRCYTNILYIYVTNTWYTSECITILIYKKLLQLMTKLINVKQKDHNLSNVSTRYTFIDPIK